MAQFAGERDECNTPVITETTNLLLELQNFVLQLIVSSLEVVKLLLFGLESFFCLFGVRSNIMDRRIRFDLRKIFVRDSSAAEPLQQLTMMTH